MSVVRDLLLEAIVARAKAKIKEAEAVIELLLKKPAAIGEHTNGHYIDDLYAAFEQLHDAQGVEKLICDYN